MDLYKVEKDVREFLRASDILIARLQAKDPLSSAEISLIESYTTRIKSLLTLLRTEATIEESRKLGDGLS